MACDNFLYGFKVAAYGRAGCGAAPRQQQKPGVGEKEKGGTGTKPEPPDERTDEGKQQSTTQGESSTPRATLRVRGERATSERVCLALDSRGVHSALRVTVSPWGLPSPGAARLAAFLRLADCGRVGPLRGDHPRYLSADGSRHHDPATRPCHARSRAQEEHTREDGTRQSR
jgi:hypothetical protein